MGRNGLVWSWCKSWPYKRCASTYLGHIINNKSSDCDDIEREIKNLFVRCNMLRTRFNMCSTAVKCVLFKTYCLCFYNIALWRNYTVNRFKASYHKSVKKFFGFARTDSMTDIIVSLKLPSVCTVLLNARVRFCAQSSLSCNAVVAHFNTIGAF